MMPTYIGRTLVTYVQRSPLNHLLDGHIASFAVDSQSLVVASDSFELLYHPSDLKIRVTDKQVIL